jgi:NADH:ubiquinone oxidoreductase subunit 4 (subunit M)
MTRLLYGNFIWPVFFNKKFWLKKSPHILLKPEWNLITTTQDLTRIEFFSLIILVFYSILFGICPNYLLDGINMDFVINSLF